MTAEIVCYFTGKHQGLQGSSVREEIPDRALNCEEDWHGCEFNNCQFECKERLCGVQWSSPSMLSASYPPFMDPVMDTASEGFKERRDSSPVKIELVCKSIPWQTLTKHNWWKQIISVIISIYMYLSLCIYIFFSLLLCCTPVWDTMKSN